MGLFSRHKPKIKVQTTKKDSFSGWVKCTHCNELIHANEVQENLHCCPKCDYHYRLSGTQRIQLLADENTFQELFTQYKSKDALGFVDTETYVKRLEDLEQIATSYNEVEKAYAIQAGRELRVLVQPEKISDADAVMLCKDITKKIESQLTYPGQIKVTVIRETRAINFAK